MTDLRNVSAFRDFQVAMDFQQMAEDGYLDTEFTMYGTMYYQDGERHYLISANEEKIIDFIRDAVWSDIHPMPLETLTEVCQVPLGEKETIAQSVKIRLAQKLSASYPIAFMQMLERYATIPASDMAYELLMTLFGQVKNTFNREELALTKQMVQLAYASKALQKATCQKLLYDLAKEQENLQDDVIAKAHLKKTWYTLAYRTEQSSLKRLTNARLSWIYHKQQALEMEEHVVSPIFERTYWYDNSSQLGAIKSQHQQYSEALLNENYFEQVETIANYSSVIDRAAFLADLSNVQITYGEKAFQAMVKYGRLWHVLI